MGYTRKILVAAMMFAVGSSAQAADLVGVYDLALRNDPQLKAAAFRRDATGENKTQAWANFLPNLTANASQTRGASETFIAGIQTSDSDTDTENLGLNLNQTIYNRANYGQLDRARAEVTQADANYQTNYQDFLLRVAQSYFNVLTAEDGVRFSEAEEKALQRQFDQAEQRFEVGLTAVTDVHEARASYDNARARAIVARNTLEDAKQALQEVTGEFFETLDPLAEELPLEKPAPATAEEWVEIGVASNPALIAAEKAAEIADANIDIQKSGHYPTVDLDANYGEFTNNELVQTNDLGIPIGTTSLENDSHSFTLRLNVPIYSGGAVRSRTKQAAFLYEAAMEDYEQQHRATVRAVNNAFRAVTAGIQEVEAFKQALVSAQSALEATQAGFEVGTRTIVDVLISEQRYFQAQRDYSTARHDYIINHLQLRQAAGILTADDLSNVNALLD